MHETKERERERDREREKEKKRERYCLFNVCTSALMHVCGDDDGPEVHIFVICFFGIKSLFYVRPRVRRDKENTYMKS